MNAAPQNRSSVLRGLLRSEASSGLVLMAAAALALLIANSAWSQHYFDLLEFEFGGWSLLHWINDALMAVFFLLVGLEIKREFVDGELSSWRRRLLPGVAALGGMAVPALVYLAFNWSDSVAVRGWAIPTATDIAFALGVLALFGKRVPVSLKVFLTALAIIDDLGAVAIIALFYSSGIDWLWLAGSVAVVGLLTVLNRRGVKQLALYLVAGVLLWLLVLGSGIHPTIAGVALALTIPVVRTPGRPDDRASPLHRLEHALQPWVGYAIVPLFGFANAGVALSAAAFTQASGIPLGIAAGLVVGKSVGVFASAWVAIKLGLADRPSGASGLQLLGVSVLTGIGFTMSLFIGLLAFPGAEQLEQGVKVGVLGGSLAAALLGSAILLVARREPAPTASR